MNKAEIGFSTGVYYPQIRDLKESLSRLLQHSVSRVELNLANPSLVSGVDEQIIALLNKFESVSIHAPFHDVVYDIDSISLLKQLKFIASKVNAEYVLFHPNLVKDFALLSKILGDLAAIENMDVRKDTGQTLEDLLPIFAEHPEIGWVCDVNHIYSIDTTMQLAQQLHDALAARLVGYHLSGYGSPSILHTCLYLTQEKAILNAIQDWSISIIHEGGNANDPDFIEKELSYINEFVSQS